VVHRAGRKRATGHRDQGDEQCWKPRCWLPCQVARKEMHGLTRSDATLPRSNNDIGVLGVLAAGLAGLSALQYLDLGSLPAVSQRGAA
jgi:hypothetical protein